MLQQTQTQIPTKQQAVEYLNGKINLYQTEIDERTQEISIYQSQILVLRSVVKLVVDESVKPEFVVVQEVDDEEPKLNPNLEITKKTSIKETPQGTNVILMTYEPSDLKVYILDFVKNSPPIGTKEIFEHLKESLPNLEQSLIQKLVTSLIDSKKLKSVARGLYQINVVVEEKKEDNRPQFLATNYKYPGGRVMCIGDHVRLLPSAKCSKDTDILDFPDEVGFGEEGEIVEHAAGSSSLTVRFKESKTLVYPHWIEFVKRKEKAVIVN